MSVRDTEHQLHWDIRKRNGRDGGPNLDEPRQEENERYEIEVGAPARETVNGPVHEEHPTLLRCSFVHGEDARTWEDKTQMK